jgi:hypothetical protein
LLLLLPNQSGFNGHFEETDILVFSIRESVFKFCAECVEAKYMTSVISPALSAVPTQKASGSLFPESGRTDDQKQCRKIVIRTGLRLAQKSGLLLTAGVVTGMLGFAFNGSTTIAMLGLGVLLIVAALPLISIGKSLSRTNSPMLAAIDDPSLISAMHVSDRPRAGRTTVAVRFLDDRMVQMAIKADELAVLRAYYAHEREDLRIQASDNPTRTIRPAFD